MEKIGLPRALHFLQYYPLWRTFFNELGTEVVVSPPTDRSMLASGARLVADVMCLPVKVYAGHVTWLRDQAQVDRIFVPAIRSVERGAMHCSKFQALPDLLHAVLPDCPPLLEMEIDAHRYKILPEEAYRRLGKQLNGNYLQVRRAWKRACEADAAYQSMLVRQKLSYPQALAQRYPDDWQGKETSEDHLPSLKIALLGHPYCLYDEFINHDLLRHLTRLGAGVVTSEMISEDEARRGIELTTGQKRWFYENWMSGAAGIFLSDPAIDGVISVQAFTCGPDSAMVETISRRAHHLGRPFMNLVLDEHGSATGMITRLEAFVDMLNRQKRKKTPASTRSQAPSPEKNPRIHPPNLLQAIHQPRLGFPRMGTSALALKTLFTGIGAQVELGPSLSSRTISLGVRYSPEFICTPYKYILGNMIEMLEAGADTLLYMDGAELCRNSSYTQMMNDALHDLGYKFRLVSTAVFEKGGVFALPRFLAQFMDSFSRKEVIRQIFRGIQKMNILDEIERRVQFLRPRELIRGSVEKLWEEALQRLEEVAEIEALKAIRDDLLQKLGGVEVDPARQPVKIGTTGEYYAVLEPFFNHDIERTLGRLGAEVHRSLMLGDWVQATMILEALGIHKSEVVEAARPYLRWNIGGEGQVTVGQSVLHAQRGFDGMVELLPFTCLPEITVLNILPRLSREQHIPIMPFILDEQSGQAGMQTRLEAFVDLLYRRRAGQPAFS